MAIGESYCTDILYVPHYTHRLSPAFMRFALLLRGYDFPARAANEPFRYLELGFGRGDSLIAHAASCGGEFWGVDFLSGHCDAAREAAKAAGLGSRCRILHNSFAEAAAMAEAGELPLFDVVALHGVWSWVDAANREHILRIVRTSLKEGGAAYVSYNALPGWAVFMPLRDVLSGMMAECAQTAPGTDAETRVRAVMDRLVALTETDGAYFRLNPLCGIYLAEMAKKPPAFLAHDFFNPTWRPFSFREAAGDFLTAGCVFAASADLFHHADSFLPPGMADRVREASSSADPYLEESLRDLALNTQFRADLFLRSPRRADAGACRDKLAAAAIRPAVSPEDALLEITYGLNKARLDSTPCRAILDALARNSGLPTRIGDLPGGLPATENGMRRLIECLSIMRETGYILEADPVP
ncbi:MAG: methyltransferase regulatory domain-containing protein [Planctomycetota bacterium]|nr:methyltransferase regulatory domain-containing protein [Planctomycetota bacterium]